MALVSLLDVSLSFGGAPLLDRVNLQIDRGERVCLVGRNGAGKSTLMKVIAGELKPDEGQVFRSPPDAVIATLRQEVPAGLTGTVQSVVEGEGGSYEEHNDWERHDRVERLIEQMGLPATAEFASLSAGQKRRVLLARGLVEEPQLLLLDEPTNHLDLESIQWLEEFLLEWGGALLFVTHDRAFLRKLATRIVEVDRGRLIGWPCDYDTFLVRKQAVLEAEEVQRAQFDKKLAQEEEWIRRGVKAQRSRAQNRINALKAMRAERAARRERTGTAKLTAQEAERSGFKVITCENASFRYQDRWIVRDFSTRIERGDKIGIVGPNGAGKTTLLRLLLGQLAPQAGTVEHGTKLEIVYFDQLRAQLDESMRVQDAVADGNATVTINGRTRHVISYLEDFLFEPARARTPIKALSGGERNRLLLARLFTKPANVLVLDEPTNDLDAETLELLEDLLVEFNGTVLLVSHDRAFLNEVSTSLLVFEGDGRIEEYVGGYDDWQKERVRRQAAVEAASSRAMEKRGGDAPSTSGPTDAGVAKKARKLSNKERAELEALPKRIETLEAEQATLTAKLADPLFFKKPATEVTQATVRLHEIEAELARAYARWAELEG
jgi:ATP-binding cassette subfamily F protein uup